MGLEKGWKLSSKTFHIVFVLFSVFLIEGISLRISPPPLNSARDVVGDVASISIQERISKYREWIRQSKGSNHLEEQSGGDDAIAMADAKFLVESIVPSYIADFLRNETAKRVVLEKLQNQEPPTPCITHIGELFGKVFEIMRNLSGISDPKNTWALQMIDSWGKIPEGILGGHVNSYGDYDECVGVDGGDDVKFDGLYCWVYLIPGIFFEDASLSSEGGVGVGIKKAGSVSDLIYNMLHQVAGFVMPSTTYCVPSTCSTEEFQEVAGGLFSILFPTTLPIVSACQKKEDKRLDMGAKSMIGVIAVLGCFIVVGSVLDVVFDYWGDAKFGNAKKETWARLLLAFSLPTNIAKWCNTGGGEGGGFGCIHGLRFLSTCWVLLSHAIYLVRMQGPVWNTVDVNNIHKRGWPIYIILNGFFAVDTFFAMSGLLACYTLLKMLDKSRGKVNIFMFYLHRYLRLTPTYALIIGVIANLFKYMGSGPFFSVRAEFIGDSCRKYWWHNLLYINNVYFYDASKEEAMCEGESWYLANDMQFFIVSPLFVFLLWKWKRIGVGVLGAASLASILAPGIVIGTEHLQPTQILWKMGSNPNPRAMNVYNHPWYRIGPYLAGIWMGYLFFKIGKKPVKLPKLAVAGGWMLSTAGACGLIFGVIPYYDPAHDDNYLVAGIYGGLSRFLWGVIICWVIFACVKGYGGWVNSFLGWKAFIPLGRLTFCVYLSSLSVQMILQLTLRQGMNFDMYNVTNMFFSHVIMCFLVGFVLSMIFESPFIALEKVIFSGGGPQGREEKSRGQANGGGGFIEGRNGSYLADNFQHNLTNNVMSKSND